MLRLVPLEYNFMHCLATFLQSNFVFLHVFSIVVIAASQLKVRWTQRFLDSKPGRVTNRGWEEIYCHLGIVGQDFQGSTYHNLRQDLSDSRNSGGSHPNQWKAELAKSRSSNAH